jgi:hypothetical protein
MSSLYSGQSIPDAAREIRVAVGGASAVIDAAYLLEFRKGQRRVDRPEVVRVFIDGAILRSKSLRHLRRRNRSLEGMNSILEPSRPM